MVAGNGTEQENGAQPAKQNSMCEAAWSIAGKFYPNDSERMKELAAAIHGAVLNENRRCANLIKDTERLSTGMAIDHNGDNPVKEMCETLSKAIETSFTYR